MSPFSGPKKMGSKTIAKILAEIREMIAGRKASRQRAEMVNAPNLDAPGASALPKVEHAGAT
jgi:hypothetical protein